MVAYNIRRVGPKNRREKGSLQLRGLQNWEKNTLKKKKKEKRMTNLTKTSNLELPHLSNANSFWPKVKHLIGSCGGWS